MSTLENMLSRAAATTDGDTEAPRNSFTGIKKTKKVRCVLFQLSDGYKHCGMSCLDTINC